MNYILMMEVQSTSFLGALTFPSFRWKMTARRGMKKRIRVRQYNLVVEIRIGLLKGH
jgi:hypothetical protein